MLDGWNLDCLMVESMMNTIVLVSWKYRKYLWCKMIFCDEMGQIDCVAAEIESCHIDNNQVTLCQGFSACGVMSQVGIPFWNVNHPSYKIWAI